MKMFINTVSALALVLISVAASATVFRVNNQPGVDADFNTAPAAISAAQIDDTLYFEGSPISYGEVSLNKRLVIIGSGYFLTENDSTQAIPLSSRFDELVISSGGAGSVITGIQVENTSSSTSSNNTYLVFVDADDVQLIRCYFRHAAPGSSSFSGSTVRVNSSHNNVLISQCFIRQDRVSTATSGSSYNTHAVEISTNCQGIVLVNNILKFGNKTTAYSFSGQYALEMESSSSAVIVNNVIMGRIEAYNSVFANNIQIIGGNTPAQSFQVSSEFPNVVQNNIGHDTQFGTDNGNQSSVNMTNVFTYGPGNENIDNHYQLSMSSPAIGAGVTGEDCGAFGGDNAIKLSGLPGIPAIFQTIVPAVGNTTDGLNITLDAKSHQ